MPAERRCQSVAAPAEFVNHRSERQTRIGCASCDDDLRALVQSFDHRPRAKIGVGTLYMLAHGGERLIRIHVAQLDAALQHLVNAWENVVARDDAYAKLSREAKPARYFKHGLGAAAYVDAPCVGRHTYVALDTRGENLLHERNKIARVSGGRVTRALLLHDRHRDFGQIVEHQIINGAALNLTHGRVQLVAPEPLPARNTNLLSHLKKSPKSQVSSPKSKERIGL